MKNLHRPIPKSKILQELKKTNETNGNKSTASQSHISQTPPTNSQSSLAQRKTATTANAASGSKTAGARKSLSKKRIDEKPKNTIRSMFAKQLEMSQRSNEQSSQINGTLDKITTLNINESGAADKGEAAVPRDDELHEKTTAASVEILVSGSLHKRLTRRNSITLKTPTKAANESDDIVPVTPSSIKKRRCTMFTPSLKSSIEEDIFDVSEASPASTPATASTGTSATSSNQTVIAADKTLNKSVAMDVCNQSKSDKINRNNTPCTSKVRQLLNDDLSKRSCNSSLSSSVSDANQFMQPKIRLPLQSRRTTFTVQPMDETKLLQNSSRNGITPINNHSDGTPVLNKRRNTMYVNAGASTPTTTTTTTPHAKMVRNLLDLNKSNSCDAILTPTNKTAGNFPFGSIAKCTYVLIDTKLFNICRRERAHIHTIISIIVESASRSHPE